MTRILHEILCLIWIAAIGTTLIGTWLTLRKLGRQQRHGAVGAKVAATEWLPISILKPIRGIDSDLHENLASFFHLDYPHYELIFCVARADDPACPVIRRLIAINPEVQARLVIRQVDIGPNPKVNNLVTGYGLARNEWILISDSNVRVRPDYLDRLASSFGSDVGMLTCPVSGRGSVGLGGRLEATFLNTFYVRAMTLAFAIGHPCVIGKSMMFRRSTLERIGGLRALAPYLAEDYVAGQRVAALGLKVIALDTPVQQHIGEHGLEDFWLRHLRWGRLRKVQAPFLFFLEFWISGIVSGVLGAYGVGYWDVSAAAFLALHFSVWAACDLAIMRRMGQAVTPENLLAWCLREATHPWLWLHIASSNRVRWRGQTLRLRWGGGLAPRIPEFAAGEVLSNDAAEEPLEEAA